MAKSKIHSTTQDFTEVVDIVDDIVLLKGKNACSVLDVSSVNFFLLSQDEQNARIYGYMSLLNSLSFQFQILIISKRIDLSAYLKLLEQRIGSVQNARVSEHLTYYRDFIQTLVKGEQLLDKKIYIVIPFSPLELGPVAGTSTKNKENFVTQVRAVIDTKRGNLMTQIERVGLMSRILRGEELAELFYEVFNQEQVNLDFDSGDIKNVIL